MSTRTARRIQVGATVVTADDLMLGTIEKIGRKYAYTKSGQRVHLDSYLETWATV